MLHNSDIGTGPSEHILSPKQPIYPRLGCLYQEMVALHGRNKLQGLSTHRHNARHTLSACIVMMFQDLHHTHCHRGPLLSANVIRPYYVKCRQLWLLMQNIANIDPLGFTLALIIY